MLLSFLLPCPTSSVNSDLTSRSTQSSGSRLENRQWNLKSGGNEISMDSSALRWTGIEDDGSSKYALEFLKAVVLVI